jgi:hypothetical protein
MSATAGIGPFCHARDGGHRAFFVVPAKAASGPPDTGSSLRSGRNDVAKERIHLNAACVRNAARMTAAQIPLPA